MDWASVPSPIGPLGVAADEQGIRFVRFDGPAGPLSTNPHLSLAAEQLAAYFAGSRTGFALPLAPAGGTPFERAVWRAIADIPYGETDTYGRIAARVGETERRRHTDPAQVLAHDAARAVGVACNRNPLPLVVPCHRVVGARGKLVGFGGGLPRKRYLLELEARVVIEREFTCG